MSYALIDASVSSGSPAELYRFTYWDQRYRYCTLDGGVDPFTYSIAGTQEVFSPTSIRKGTSEVTEEIARNTLEITMPINLAVPQLFLGSPPDGTVGITVYRFHVTDTDNSYITVFKGRVISSSAQDTEASLNCEPIFTSLRRPGLRRYYTPHCPFELYGEGCRLARSDWEIQASVIGVDRSLVTVQTGVTYADNWFAGGVFKCGTVRRMIMSSTSTTLKLAYPVPTAVNGQACLLLPGCNHTRADCHTKFNNIPNYGGFDWLPLKNAYKGDNVFW